MSDFFRDSKRLSSILSRGLKYRFLYFLIKLKNPSKKTKIAARLTREMLEELGPTFIKLGQLASVRPDIVHPDFILELENLQDNVKPMDLEFIEGQIVKELGIPLGNIFSQFDDEPVASASIGQVHKGILREEKEIVAVKIMRPGVRKLIDADVSLLRKIAKMFQPRFKFVNLNALIDEFNASLHREMDYHVEANHIKIFKDNFSDDRIIKIPKVFDDYTSKCVLTLEFINGWKLSELEVPESMGIDCYGLAKHGAEAFIRQVLEFCFFHGDLHPANLMVTPDSKIAYLDFGIVGQIPKEHRKVIANLLMAIIRQDIEDIVNEAGKIGVEITPENINQIRPELKNILDRYHGKTLGEVKIDIIGREFLELIYKHHIKIPTNYAMLAKALITIEGTAKKLYPEINILEIAEPYVRKLMSEKLGEEKTKEQLKKEISDITLKLADIPKQVHDVLDQLRKGELTIRQKQTGLGSLSRTINYSAILIALSVFFGASFITFTVSFIAVVPAWLQYLSGFLTVVFFLAASIVCYKSRKLGS